MFEDEQLISALSAIENFLQKFDRIFLQVYSIGCKPNLNLSATAVLGIAVFWHTEISGYFHVKYVYNSKHKESIAVFTSRISVRWLHIQLKAETILTTG